MRTEESRPLSRREVLAAGLAASGALAMGRLAEAQPSTEKGPYGPFRMGIQSYSLRHFKVGEALAKTKELGLHYWESYSAHIPADIAKVGEAKFATSEAGVQVVGYGVVRFSKDHEANSKLFAFAKALGVEYLSADPEPDSFESLDKLVGEYGIAVGIHNHGPGHKYAKIDDIAAAIKDHDPKIGCCIDTGHFLRSKEDPVRAAEVFAKRIFGVHLKDVKDAKTFTVLGDGDLRTAALLKVLAAQQYRHCLALEYEENPSDPMADLRVSLAAVRKAVESIQG